MASKKKTLNQLSDMKYYNNKYEIRDLWELQIFLFGTPQTPILPYATELLI